MITSNSELKFLLNFLDIWKKNYKKKQVIWIEGKNTKNHTSWQQNQYPEKKKGEGGADAKTSEVEIGKVEEERGNISEAPAAVTPPSARVQQQWKVEL